MSGQNVSDVFHVLYEGDCGSVRGLLEASFCSCVRPMRAILPAMSKQEAMTISGGSTRSCVSC